jgi:Glycosyl hydrolases family 39
MVVMKKLKYFFGIVFIFIISGLSSFSSISSASGDANITFANALPVGEPFGVCHGYGSNPTQAQEMVDQGVQITRNDIPWSHIEPSNGTYNFKHFEKFYSILTALGIEPQAILDYGNSRIFGQQFYRHIPAHMVPHWLSYVNATVSHFKDQVKYWEIWNEPNLDKFWNGTESEFFYLLNKTAVLINEIDPNLFLMAPGISGHDPAYLDRMITYIGSERFDKLFDVLNFHPYSGANAEMISSKIEDVKAVAQKHGFQGEIWITEVGYSTQVTSIDAIDAELGDKWDYQSDQTVKIFAQALAGGINRTVWYCYRDSLNINWTYGEDAFGIQHYDQNLKQWVYKPSGYAFQYLSSKLTNCTYYPNGLNIKRPITVDSSLFWSYYFYTSQGTVVLVLWSQSWDFDLEIGLENNPSIRFTKYDYKTNRAQETTGISFETPVGFPPLLIELDYSTYLNKSGLVAQPLLVNIELKYDNTMQIYLWVVPIIFLLGLISIVISSRSRKKK